MKAQKYTRETIKNIGVTDRNFPQVHIGDTVCISLRVIEAGKERMQDFEGVLIGMKGGGITQTMRIRKIGAGGVAVERIFPYHSPNISSMKVIKSAEVRRAKLYYLREKQGRDAQLTTKKTAKKNKVSLEINSSTVELSTENI